MGSRSETNKVNNQIKIITKEEYRKKLLEEILNQKEDRFKIEKVEPSKNDPILSKVNKFLESVR